MKVRFWRRALSEFPLVICIGTDGPRLVVIAVIEWLIPYRPHGNADRRGVINAQVVVTVVGCQGSTRTQSRPESNRLPIIPFRIFSNRLRIGRATVGIRDPCGGFSGLTSTASVH